MSNKEEAVLRYINYNGTTDFDDQSLNHRTINNYFFYNEENKREYRWTTKKIVELIKDKEYKIQFKVIKETGFQNEVVIGYIKIYDKGKNSYGGEVVREVHQHNANDRY